MDSLLAARLGLTRIAPKTDAPTASPVAGPGNHPPAPTAAMGQVSAIPTPKPSGLDAHHAAHVKAHKAGDFATAKTHALNYANAAHKGGYAVSSGKGDA